MIKGGGDNRGRVRGGLGWSHLLHEDATDTWTICINTCVSTAQLKPKTALKWHEDGPYLKKQSLCGRD